MYDSVIIDGNNLAYKSFFIHKKLSADVDGKIVHTGTCYGFINSLIHLKKEYLKDKSEIFVVWDRESKHRKSIYPEYKVKRHTIEDESKKEEIKNYLTQRKYLKIILPHLGVHQVYADGWEADDVIGTLSRIRSTEMGEDVLIFSSDHDYYQLITDKVHLLSHKGKDNITLYDVETFEKEFGIKPYQYYYVMCLTGCKGDEVPGVKGIGEKTALKLVRDNPNLIEDILNGNIFEKSFVGSKTVLAKLKDNIETIKLASQLVKINQHVEKLTVIRGEKNMNKVEEYFEMLEFRSFLRQKNWKILESL